MATAALVFAGANRLRYLITAGGTGTDSVQLSTTSAVTPSTLADSVGSGPIKKLSKVVADGYGTFAAGAQTAAKMLALWLSNFATNNPANPAGAAGVNSANLLIPTAKCEITPRSGTSEWAVTASIAAGAATPTIDVTHIGLGEAGTAYLDIYSPGTIGA